MTETPNKETLFAIRDKIDAIRKEIQDLSARYNSEGNYVRAVACVISRDNLDHAKWMLFSGESALAMNKQTPPQPPARRNFRVSGDKV